MTEEYVCPYGDLCDFTEEDWKQYTGGDASTGGLTLDDAKHSGAVLSIGKGDLEAGNIYLETGGSIVLQDGKSIKVENNFLNLGIVKAENGLEVRVNGHLVNAGSFESQEGSIVLKAEKIAEVKASNKAPKGSIRYEAESMQSLGSFRLAEEGITYDIGTGGLTMGALHVEKVITNDQWHNYKLIQRDIIYAPEISVARDILLKAHGDCIGSGAVLIGGDKVHIDCKKFEWNTKTTYTENEYYQKKKGLLGSTSIAGIQSVSKTSRAAIALEGGENKELEIKADECRFEGALLPKDGEINISCGKWLFLDHEVKEWEKHEVVKRGFLAPSIPVKQLMKDPVAELSGMIPAVDAVRDIVNMKGPFDLKGVLKLVSEVPVMKEWADKITNAGNAGDLMRSAGNALLDKYAKATFHIGYQRITTYQEREYSIPSEFNPEVADIDIKTGEVKGSIMKAKKLSIKIEKELILKAGRDTQYHYIEEEKMTFDIGIGTDGLSFGTSGLDSEQELKKIQHKKSIVEGEYVHIELQSNAKLEIVGAQINGKKVKVSGDEATIEIQDVIDSVKTESSHFASSIGVTVAWNGAVMPYGSISSGESLKNSQIVEFISGIQGDNVEIVAEKIMHSAGAIEAKDSLYLEAQEIIETRRPEEVNDERGYSIAAGFKMASKKNTEGQEIRKATYYSQAEYWKGGKHYSLFGNERTAEGLKDISEMLTSVERKVEQELLEAAQKSDDAIPDTKEKEDNRDNADFNQESGINKSKKSMHGRDYGDQSRSVTQFSQCMQGENGCGEVFDMLPREGKSYINKEVRIKDGKVVVQAGNNLSIIAEATGVTVEQILDLNPELKGNPDYIQAGWHLHMPRDAKFGYDAGNNRVESANSHIINQQTIPKNIIITAAYWDYIASGSDTTNEEELKTLIKQDCPDCVKDLKTIIENQKQGATLQLFNDDLVDATVDFLNPIASKVSLVIKHLAKKWDDLDSVLTKGHQKAVENGKQINIFSEDLVNPIAELFISGREMYSEIPDEYKKVAEAALFFAAGISPIKSPYNFKKVDSLIKFQKATTTDITLSEATVKYFYTRESELIHYSKIVDIEKSIFPEYNPSFTKGTNALAMQMKHGDEFVRVIYDPKNMKKTQGNWVMLREDVAGLTPQQIKEKFALKDVPTHYVDIKITNPTKEHKTLIGEVAPNFGEKGGGNQFFMGFKIKLTDELTKSWFKNKQVIPDRGIK